VYLGSGGVARIPLNICDQAQNNCIIKGRWSGGARRQEEPQSLKRKGWEIDVNPLQDILRLVFDARAWPWSAAQARPNEEVPFTVGNRFHCLGAHVYRWECDNEKKSIAYKS